MQTGRFQKIVRAQRCLKFVCFWSLLKVAARACDVRPFPSPAAESWRRRCGKQYAACSRFVCPLWHLATRNQTSWAFHHWFLLLWRTCGIFPKKAEFFFRASYVWSVCRSQFCCVCSLSTLMEGTPLQLLYISLVLKLAARHMVSSRSPF